MNDDDKQEALDWLLGIENELKDAAKRTHDLRQWLAGDDSVLRQWNIDGLEAFGHNLEIDAMMFKRRLPQ